MTTESKKPTPYDRPVIFQTAWDYARWIETLFPIPASKMFPHSIRVIWKQEKRRREREANCSDVLAVEYLNFIEDLTRQRLRREVEKLVKQRA